MKIQIIVLFVLCCFDTSLGKRKKCPSVSISNGSSKVRTRGRIIAYKCHRGYSMFGEPYAACYRGRWDPDPPVCLKPGCTPINRLNNGHIVKRMRSALLEFSCNSGYKLLGPPFIYCNGKNWNNMQPYCKAANVSCDFEDDTTCSWTIATHEDDGFVWHVQQQEPIARIRGTGPKHDHTFASNDTGHYLMIETSDYDYGSMTNVPPAKLHSPKFPVPESDNSCFIFWYHMFGSTIGKLSVYLNTVLVFHAEGNHGDRWIKGVIPLQRNGTDLQLTIEGTNGGGYTGDIGLDDFSVVNGSECQQKKVTSCRDRCEEETIPDTATCRCNLECYVDRSCCFDYNDICIEGSSTEPTSFFDETDTSSYDTATEMNTTDNYFEQSDTTDSDTSESTFSSEETTEPDFTTSTNKITTLSETYRTTPRFLTPKNTTNNSIKTTVIPSTIFSTISSNSTSKVLIPQVETTKTIYTPKTFKTTIITETTKTIHTPKTANTTDIPKTTKTTHTPKTVNKTNIPKTIKTTHTPKTAKTTTIPETTKTTNITETTKTTHTPKTVNTTNITKTTHKTKTATTTNIPETTKMTHIPKTTNILKVVTIKPQIFFNNATTKIDPNKRKTISTTVEEFSEPSTTLKMETNHFITTPVTTERKPTHITTNNYITTPQVKLQTNSSTLSDKLTTVTSTPQKTVKNKATKKSVYLTTKLVHANTKPTKTPTFTTVTTKPITKMLKQNNMTFKPVKEFNKSTTLPTPFWKSLKPKTTVPSKWFDKKPKPVFTLKPYIKHFNKSKEVKKKIPTYTKTLFKYKPTKKYKSYYGITKSYISTSFVVRYENTSIRSTEVPKPELKFNSTFEAKDDKGAPLVDREPEKSYSPIYWYSAICISLLIAALFVGGSWAAFILMKKRKRIRLANDGEGEILYASSEEMLDLNLAIPSQL